MLDRLGQYREDADISVAVTRRRDGLMSDTRDDDPIIEQEGLENTDSAPEAGESAESSHEATRTSAPKTG